MNQHWLFRFQRFAVNFSIATEDNRRMPRPPTLPPSSLMLRLTGLVFGTFFIVLIWAYKALDINGFKGQPS